MRGWIRIAVLGLLTAVIVLCPAALASAATDGSLSEQGCIAEAAADGCAAGTGLHGLHGMVVSPDGQYVYAVGKWKNSSGVVQGQIVAFERDPTTGGITEIGCVSEGGTDGCVSGHGLKDAAGVAISPDGSNVYVVSDSSSAVVTFSRDSSTGLLTETGCIAEGGADGCTTGTGLSAVTGVAVSPDGKNVYTGSEASNAVATFSRDPSTGALTEDGCIAEAGADGCATGNGLTHAENLVVSPDGSYVYATAISGSAVNTFSRDSSTGALTQLGCIAEGGADGCAAGTGLSGADGIAMSSDGTSLYVASETEGALATFSRNTSTGALTEQGCLAETSVAPDNCTATSGLKGAARVAVSPDGSNVYVDGYLDNTLVTFARDSTGALTKQGCLGEGGADGCATATGLKAPAGLAISPDGHNVYTGAETGNAADAFLRAEPYPAPSGPAASAPSSMDALGDSFTVASYSGGSCASTGPCPANSWSTGTTPAVDSQYQRIQALNPAISGHATNRAVGGKAMNYLDTEVQAMINGGDNPAYVTIMMGTNDVCGGSMTTPAKMTPTSTFQSEFKTAMTDLTSHLPGARVFVASIRNPVRLWNILHTTSAAQTAWNKQAVCPLVLPTSTATSTTRQDVLNQVIADNQALQTVCAEFTQCQFDGDAVFNWKFSPYDVDKTDYFHPSIQGQADLAQVTWQNGFDFTSGSGGGSAPQATTGAASSVTSNGATLNGTVNPEGQDTTYYFEYGTSTSYGMTTTVTDVGSGTNPVPVSVQISNLAPNQTYHFQLVASNNTSTVDGGDQSFTTSGTGTASYAQTVLASNPVAYWRLGEKSGTTAVDQQGAHNGTYTGGYTLGQPGAIQGDPDTSVLLNGTSGYVKVPLSSALNPAAGKPWSVEAWVYPTSFVNNDSTMSVINSRLPTSLGHAGYDLGLFSSGSPNSGKPYIEVGTGSAYHIFTAPSAVPLNAWTYLVATYDGTKAQLYVNGALAGSVSTTYAPNTRTALNLGALNGIAQFFPGRLDEAAVYNTALSATTISNHYTAGTSGSSGASSSKPSVTTSQANPVSATGATLNGTLNPNGQDTHYYFQWGTSTAYGHNTTSTDAGSGTADTPASAAITGLSAVKTYHFRLVASNASGTTDGGDQTFTTPAAGSSKPTVTTGQANPVSSTGATLNGSVNPNGKGTQYHFQWGKTATYGDATPNTNAGSGTTPINVSAAITGLAPSTTYHFRLVATSGFVTTYGSDQTFTTLASAGTAAPDSRPALSNKLSSNPVSCSRASLRLLEVYAAGGRLRFLGWAKTAAAGRSVRILSDPSGRTIARATVGADGYFGVTTALRAAPGSRFQAQLGTTRSDAVRAGNQIFLNAPRSSAGRLTIKGLLARSAARLTHGSFSLWKLGACGSAVRIPASLHLNRTTGAFALRAQLPRSANTRGYAVMWASHTVLLPAPAGR